MFGVAMNLPVANPSLRLALESDNRAYKACCGSPIKSILKLISWLMCCCTGHPFRRGKVWFSRTWLR